MPIRWDKFTVKAQEAIQRANELASEHGNPELAPLHLLAALVEEMCIRDSDTIYSCPKNLPPPPSMRSLS